jgi:hypothetical protein
MTEAVPVPAEPQQVLTHTCTRCEMTISWTAEAENPGLPTTWLQRDGELFCLSCRRERAAEEGLAALPEDAPADQRHKAQSRARVEFEVQRDPSRQDNRIAKSCHTSVVAVRKARVRLGLQSPPRI